jgi:hypothetical protein
MDLESPTPRRAAIFAAALLVQLVPALAQVLSGTIVGTVSDESGAALAGASVTLRNTFTDFSRTVTTNASGQYVAPSIPTGDYAITTEKAGFGTLVREGIELTAADTVTVNISLRIGDVKQTVEVKAAAPLLQSQNADVSQLIDNRRIVEMPLNGRTFTSLVLLTPGAHQGSAASLASGPYAIRGGTNYSVNGADSQNSSYLIDGMIDRSLWSSTLIIVPVLDSIQEIRVLSANYSAEYGAATGAVTVVQTKSGSNQMHGAAYEFLRNDKLDANTFFNNLAGNPKPSFRRNEFGGAAGGPIRKDKTFYFADYQGIRLSQPQTTTSTIPTIAQRNMIVSGDFSGLGTTIYDPTTVAAGASTRQPFPGNRIPAARLDPAAVKIAQLLPNPTASGAANNFTFNPPITQVTDQFDARIDQYMSASDRFFGKYSYDNSNQTTPGLLPSPANAGIPISPYLSASGNQSATSVPLHNQSLTLDYVKVLGPSAINEARAGVVRWNVQINSLGEPFSTASALGIPGININRQAGGLPGMTVSGFQVIGDNSSYPETSQMTLFQFDDNFTKVSGKHTFKFGAQFIRDRFNGFSAFPTRGAYTFNGQYTRQIGSSTAATSLADFALGAPSGVTRNILEGEFGMRFWTLGAFAQDSWRATNRLTVTLGLRYEIFQPPYDVHNHWTNFNVITGQAVLAGANGNGRTLRNTDVNNLGPRAGLAYSLTSDQKTVLRSGFGITYLEPGKGGGELYKNLPYYFSQVISTDQNGVPPLYLSNGLPIPVQPDLNNLAQLSSGSPNAWDFHLKATKALQWSVGIERQLAQNLMLDVSYVGTRSLDLITSYNYNQSYPGPGAQGPRRPLYPVNQLVTDITYVTNLGSARYNSLQVKAEKRYSAGLTLTAAYTWASYLSDSQNINNGGITAPQNARCFACNWGPAPDDMTQVFVLNHEYELPFGVRRAHLNRGWVSQVAGNWSLSGIWTAQTGGHFTATLGTAVSNSAGGGADRPNRIKDGNLSSGQRTRGAWFDTSAFVSPAQYTFGNSGSGILLGPGTFSVDLGIHRDFPFKERCALSYRAEMFNAFNHVNFSNPNATIGNAQAGTISGAGPARIMQMALKVIF